MTDHFGLDGLTAVVTGGGQGLGRGICEAFASVGARVVVIDYDTDLAEDVARSLPGESMAITADVRSKADLDDAATEAVARFGPIRTWVNNVGGMAGAPGGPSVDVPQADFEQVVDLNLTGTFLACQTAIGSMLAAEAGGAVVNICSLQGVQASPQIAAYGASKAAVAHLTRTLALEYAHAGIRVNAVAPSFVDTPASSALVSPERREQSIRAIPLGFLSEPADVAGTVLAFASNLTRFVTGQVIVADGGLSLTTARPHRGATG